MSAHRLAALAGPKPGMERMIVARRASSGSEAMQACSAVSALLISSSNSWTSGSPNSAVVSASSWECSLSCAARCAVLDQPVAQSAATGLGVGEVTGLAARFEIGVESGLADIDAGDYSWSGNGHCCVVFLSRASGHSCVPVLLRCGSVPTLPLRACRNCCDGPTKLEHGSKGRGQKRSDPAPSPH